MSPYNIFREDLHLEFNILSIVLVFCSWFITNEKLGFFSNTKPNSKDIKLIHERINSEQCLELKAYQYLSENFNYEKAKTQKEDACFYHFDDDKEMIIKERKLTANDTEVSVLFWKKDNEIKIILRSCSNYLKENKRELNSLIDKLK